MNGGRSFSATMFSAVMCPRAVLVGVCIDCGFSNLSCFRRVERALSMLVSFLNPLSRVKLVHQICDKILVAGGPIDLCVVRVLMIARLRKCLSSFVASIWVGCILSVC